MRTRKNTDILYKTGCFCLLFLFQIFFLKAAPVDSLQKKYLADLTNAGKQFSRNLKQNYQHIYSLPEKVFIIKMDSARNSFLNVLTKYRSGLSSIFFKEQKLEINSYIDKLLIEYPNNYSIYTGKTFPYRSTISARLKKNLTNLNKPKLLTSADYTGYVRSFFDFELNHELTNPVYKGTDNQVLNGMFKVIVNTLQILNAVSTGKIIICITILTISVLKK